jgi:hypothetical protein
MAAINDDAVDQAQIHNIATELGINNLTQGLEY